MAGSSREKKNCHVLSISVTLNNHGQLWAYICGRGQSALSSKCVQHAQQLRKMWQLALLDLKEALILPVVSDHVKGEDWLVAGNWQITKLGGNGGEKKFCCLLLQRGLNCNFTEAFSLWVWSGWDENQVCGVEAVAEAQFAHKGFCLPVNHHPSTHLWSWDVGCDWKDKIMNTGFRKEVPLLGYWAWSL